MALNNSFSPICKKLEAVAINTPGATLDNVVDFKVEFFIDLKGHTYVFT